MTEYQPAIKDIYRDGDDRRIEWEINREIEWVWIWDSTDLYLCKKNHPNVFVTNYNIDTLWSSTYVTTVDDMAIDRNEDAWAHLKTDAASNCEIVKLTTDHTKELEVDSPSDDTFIIQDCTPQGRLYGADSTNIWAVDKSDGSPIWNKSVGSEIIDMAVDEYGNVYIAENSDGSVQKYDSSGGHLWSYTVGGSSYIGYVDVDRNGNVLGVNDGTWFRVLDSGGSELATDDSGSYGRGLVHRGYVYVDNGTKIEKRSPSDLSLIGSYTSDTPIEIMEISFDGRIHCCGTSGSDLVVGDTDMNLILNDRWMDIDVLSVVEYPTL